MFQKQHHTALELAGQLILLLSAIVALIHGLKIYPPELVYVTKTTPVALLALLALINIKSVDHAILFFALAISALADYLIAQPTVDAFMNGLLTFLVVQIIYIFLFLKNRLPAKDVTPMRLRLASLMWAMTILAIFVMYPDLDSESYNVVIYSFSLTAMATAALISRFPFTMVGVGAVLFYISDSLIGAQQFMNAPDYLGYIVWATYYVAQVLITLGVLIGKGPNRGIRY
ncbi:lysoplasmalogenase [Kordiimonas sediminis]|nr:lysoplasmalogenase [Kordiimonas sediminis]